MAERKHVYLSDAEMAHINKHREREGRSFSNYIQQLIRKDMKDKERKR